MTIFIKPSNGQFCIAVFNTGDSVIELSHVAFVKNEAAIIDFLNQRVGIEKAYFDGTVHYQTAMSIRQKMDLQGILLIYKQDSKNIHERIEAQHEWILENIYFVEEYKRDADYIYFVQLLSDYNKTNPNCDPIAADIMADAARHLRKQAIVNN